MNNTNRRNFLKSSATFGAGITLTTQFNSTWAGIKGANTDVRAAVIGCGGKGSAHARHLKSLAKMGVRVTGACDPDTITFRNNIQQTSLAPCCHWYFVRYDG